MVRVISDPATYDGPAAPGGIVLIFPLHGKPPLFVPCFVIATQYLDKEAIFEKSAIVWSVGCQTFRNCLRPYVLDGRGQIVVTRSSAILRS